MLSETPSIDLFKVSNRIKRIEFFDCSKEDSDGQEFSRGNIVMVEDKLSVTKKMIIEKNDYSYALGSKMGNYPTSCPAVIEFSHDQRFGIGITCVYSLLLLDHAMKPQMSLGWYHQYMFTIRDDGVRKGLSIIEAYKAKIGLNV